MTENEATKEARKRDLAAKAGFWFKAVERKGEWVVVKINGETSKQRVVAS